MPVVAAGMAEQHEVLQAEPERLPDLRAAM